MNKRDRLAYEILKVEYPKYVSPTEVGKRVGEMLGKPNRHSSFGSPICRRLCTNMLASRNEAGHYQAIL